MILQVPDEYASSVKSLLLYAGIPREDEREGIEELKESGGKIIFFLNPDEKKLYTLKPDEAGVNWESDALVQKWLMENMHVWTGGQVGGSSPEHASKFAAVLMEVINLTNFDNSSLKFLTKHNEPGRNAYKNWRWAEDGIPLKRARGLGKHLGAVIIAAGPSLDGQWEDLALLQRTVPALAFIVCGRSYRKCMEVGIRPDFVVEVEQFDWDDKIFMFAPPPDPQTIFCGPITTCPNLFHIWPHKKLVMLDHNTAQFMGLEVGVDSMDGGNSILHHMFNLALVFECPRIYLAGADLSYPVGSKETHAGGTFHDSWPRWVSVAEHNRQEHLEVAGTDGTRVSSSQPYRNFCLYLEMQIASSKKKTPDLSVWNLSPHGQKIEGAEYKDLKEWVTPSSPAPSLSPPPSSPESSSSPAASEPTSSSSTTTEGS